MTRALVALCLLAGCAGPGAAVAWQGRSPDGAHRASVIELSGAQRLIVDGRAVGRWNAIGLTHLVWSERGVVVPVQTDAGWHVWEAAALGPAHEAVGELRVAADDVVYAALGDAGWRVIVNGSPGRAYTSIRAGSIVTERGHVAYVARDASGWRAVVDGTEGPAFRRVERLGFAGKGESVVYVGYEDDGARIVVDGEATELHDAVHELAISPREPRWAAIVEQHGELWVLRDGARRQVPRATRGLAMSVDGARVGWVSPSDDGARVVVDGEPQLEHADVLHLGFVPVTNTLLYVARVHHGMRVVHAGDVGPRFDSIEGPVTSLPGHWGYAGHRRGGSAVVIDGELVYRGEWSSAPTLSTSGAGWAFLIRRAGRRYVVTPAGRAEVPRPFVDTLVLDERGTHWAIAVADEARRSLRVVVDGDDVADLAMEELAAEIGLGRGATAAARALVASELARAAD